MNPFKVFDEIKFQYQSYIKTFQKFKNKEIEEFVRTQSEHGNLLWREPLLQITKKFKQGKKLTDLVEVGILDKQCLNIFKIGDNVIHPYFHQQQSIEIAVKKQQNLIVTTGTASGKSLCFEIPIINYCLNKKVEGQRGIKAIIIYPMNALANSQYYELAKKLNGTGLKIGIYTGDTKADKDTALQSYRDIFGQDAQPNDSEIISRLEMQLNPPDILITNYVQLELLLTRLEDRGLFPEGYRENLKFLVIDELHTYRGKKATDVAFLIRRLKQRTNTSGNLICIGTSATMVSEKEGVNSDEVVAEFATKFFGEKFLPENVVKETEDETLYFKGEILNPSIEVTEDLINNFNESNTTSIAALYKSLMGSDIKTDFSFEELGEKLKSSKTLFFIETKLSEHIYGFNELADKYHIEVRSTFSKQQAALELLAGFYLGMSGQITTDTGNVVPRFITKLHTFFNQGKELRKCIIDECGYISSSGEITCPKCKEEGRGTVTLLPLHFCRICGQEYFGVGLLKDNKIVPWSIYDFESPEVTGYYSNNVDFTIPDDYPDSWLTPVKREIKSKYKDLVPRQISLDTTKNKYATYYNEDELKGIFIPNPMRMCINCKTEHGGQVREYTKLFLLNSIGRATGTNVLTAASINATSGNEKKVIAFSDNRQDSAFQAGHFNDWYNQIFFRQALHQVLSENQEGINVKDIPSKLFEKLVPSSMPRNPMFRRFQRHLLRYLETYLFVEIRGTKKFASQNLEDVGLLEVNYEELWDWIHNPAALKEYDLLKKVDKDLLYDYLTGFMDIFRLEVAINHNDLINKEPFRQEVISYLESEHPEYRLFEAIENTKPGGFSDGIHDKIKYMYNPHALSTSRRFSSWIEKAFGPQDDDSILKETLDFLGSSSSGYLIKNTENHQEVILLTSDLILLKLPSAGFKAKCPRCDAKYNWKKMNYCVQLKCTDPLQDYSDSHNYYYHQYSLIPNSDIIVRAADHSAQVKGDLRKQRENDFKAGKLNLLVSTPTMELGIDIGTLSSIYMRNVPPNPSNYVQRAGRAGRSGQGSLITTFCGSGPGRGSHDQYFYNRPMEMVSGKISMPRFNLDNVKLFLAHVNSLILQTIDNKLYKNSSKILNYNDILNKIPMFPDYKRDLNNSVNKSKQNIIDGIKKAFGIEIENSDGELNWILIENQINNFVENLDSAFDNLREDFLESLKEFTNLDDKIRRENQADNSIFHVRRTALEKRNQDIKDGEGEFYVYRYLSQVGFLPNYAFPTITKQIRFLYEKAEESINREQVIALTEFAPHNTLYYEGQKFLVEHITGETDLNNQEEFLICEFCGFADKLKTNQTRPTNCISCGSTLENVHSIKALNMPRMRARKRMRITSDEEERIKQGYLTEHSYRLSTNTKHFNLIAAENTFANLSFERSATMFHFNLGFRSEKDRGFIIDPHTNKWLLVGNLQEHFQNNPANARNVIRNLALFVKSENDIVAFRDGIFHGENEESFARTLLYTLLQSISYTLNLDDAELNGFIQLMPDQPSRIIIFEVSEGGTGTLSAILKDSVLLRRIAEKSLEILHIKKDKTDSNDACIKACYNCICSFYNQFYHTQFDRNLVKEFFFRLAELDTIEHIQLQDYDFVYDEFIRQCKSSLEKEVLSILKELKIQPPESIHEVISHEGILIAEADLFYKPRLCVFIDGPDHDKDYIIKDDAEKRDKLKGLGKNIVVIRYDNLIDDIEKLLYLVSPESLSSPQLLTLKFNYFKSVWKEEKKLISSPSKIQSLESYNKILELGEKVLPLIIDDLKNEPDFWFEALRRLTGTDPVEEKNKGNVELMSKDWINWYEQRS